MRNLGDIENPRLQHLAERLLRWKFQIQHVAGATDFNLDALSHSPTNMITPRLNKISADDQSQSDALEAQVMATSTHRCVLLVSWEMIKTAGISDEKYSTLLQSLNSDTSTWHNSLQFRNTNCSPTNFCTYRVLDQLSTDGGSTYMSEGPHT